MDSGERGILPAFQKSGNGADVHFHNNAIGNFMVYQDRIETNLLQLFVYPEKTEWCSIIFVIIFEVNIAAEQEQV